MSLSVLMSENPKLLICFETLFSLCGKQTADEGCLIVLIGSSRLCSVWLVVGWGWAKANAAIV